jgi:hypothetical protein
MAAPNQSPARDFGTADATSTSVAGKQKSTDPERNSKMAIQKKSLISNRTATKKALVVKPEVTGNPGMSRVGINKVGINKVGINKVGINRVGINKVGINKVGINKVGINKVGINKVGINRVGINRVGINRVGINRVKV